MKTCPFCAEEIKDAAIKCRYCGSTVRDSGVGDDPMSVTARSAGASVHAESGEAGVIGEATSGSSDENVGSHPDDEQPRRKGSNETRPEAVASGETADSPPKEASKLGRAVAGLLALNSLVYPFVHAARGKVSGQEFVFQVLYHWFILFPLFVWVAKNRKPSPVLAWVRQRRSARLGCLILALGFLAAGLFTTVMDTGGKTPAPPGTHPLAVERFTSDFLALRNRVSAVSVPFGQTMLQIQRCESDDDCDAALEAFERACANSKAALVRAVSDLERMNPPESLRPFFGAYSRMTKLKLEAIVMYQRALQDPELDGLVEAELKWREVIKSNQAVLDEVQKYTSDN